MGEDNRDTPVTTTPEPARQLAQSNNTIAKHISTATSMSERNSVSATIKTYFVFTLVAWGLVLAAPFLPNTSGLLGTLCLAAGMALAWRLNRRDGVLGPFSSSNERPMSARRIDSVNIESNFHVCPYKPSGPIVPGWRVRNSNNRKDH
jgi:hypothetical protein